MRARTSYRDIFLLACCQALLLTNAAGLITMSGLVGFSLTEHKALATLGVTTYVLGSALSTMPLSLWMARVGRRRGFMAAALINIAGCLLGVVAVWQHSFVLFCIATAVIGVYNAAGLQYRFAAAEVATAADKAKAISWVLAGGIAGGFLGPESVILSRDLSRRRSRARSWRSPGTRSSRSPCSRGSTCRDWSSRPIRMPGARSPSSRGSRSSLLRRSRARWATAR